MIHVQIEAVADVNGPGQRLAPGLCATCTKCGRVAKCPFPEKGGIGVKISTAKTIAFQMLEDACTERVFGCIPDHIDRLIPPGVNLYVEAKNGEHLAAFFDKSGKPNAITGAIPKTARLLVRPESNDYAGAASEFSAWLRKKGWTSAVAVGSDFELNLPKKAAVSS